MQRPEREAILRRRILDGDSSAWDELYVECFDALWVVAARRVGPDRSRIEDVVGETWLVAVRRIGRFDPDRGSFRSWLFGIADRVAKNATRRWLRRDGAPRRPLHEAELVLDPGRGTSPPWEARELLEASFASLPERYRSVLREKYVDELSVDEIAKRRAATPKAVESLLGRARGAFREAYRRLADPAGPGSTAEGAVQ